jgi:NAD(P)-dependent dehydrogenase (short-subunit alcohol dehydrogenase family)
VTGVAIVTGAGSGIGRVTARALLAAGWRVALAGRRADPLQATAEGAAPETVAVLPTDVRDAEAVDALFVDVAARFGRVDLLFNNAGTFGAGGPFESVSLMDWQDVVDTNLTGAFLCARAAYRVMKSQSPQGGRIINNGSLAAHVPRPHAAGYTASKHAITGLTRTIALEGRRHGIACGQLDIGNAATPLADSVQRGVLQADGSTLAEPVIDPENVARAVLYMAGLPLDANTLCLTVMATGMPFAGRG